MSIYERIRAIRTALGLTQLLFAERISISASYLAGIELGDKNVNDRIIKLICAEFDVDEHWLKTGEGSMYDETANINLTKITSLFKSLSPNCQKCAVSQLNALAELDNATTK